MAKLWRTGCRLSHDLEPVAAARAAIWRSPRHPEAQDMHTSSQQPLACLSGRLTLLLVSEHVGEVGQLKVSESATGQGHARHRLLCCCP